MLVIFLAICISPFTKVLIHTHFCGLLNTKSRHTSSQTEEYQLDKTQGCLLFIVQLSADITIDPYFVSEISSSHGGEYDVQSCLLGYTAV
jgi:hypothetical protein